MFFVLNLLILLVLKFVVGMDEGIIIYILSGIFFVDFNKKFIVLVFFILINLCGLVMIVVVFDFNNFFDNLIGIIIVDLICICVLIKLGDIYLLL